MYSNTLIPLMCVLAKKSKPSFSCLSTNCLQIIKASAVPAFLLWSITAHYQDPDITPQSLISLDGSKIRRVFRQV
jgi:hypothetical protein